MLLELNKLRGQRQHFDRRFEPSDFDPQDKDYTVVAPVELSMDVEKVGSEAYGVQGHATTRLELECGRCLEPFESPVDTAFELRYVPELADVTEPDREVTDDDLTTAYYSEGALDVTEMLREQFQLALPMKPLCTEACKGLCPQCGTNLNRTQCGCTPRWEDPRLAALKGLLQPDKEN